MKPNNERAVLSEIRRVLDAEADAVRAVRAAVGPEWARAVRALASCRGKVILTGVGKSGVIAEKIAQTLSSTGTPAAFLDPLSALHGSVGFIEKRDLVVAVGKSGESDEINGWLPTLRRIGAQLIAITANPKSTLARHADIVLLTPIREEACPLNLAPTSSTTAALAAGDALAVALMKKRGFRAEHFARNHPGGRLGRRLNLLARDVMRSGEANPVAPLASTGKQLLLALTRFQAGAVSVVDGRGRFVGLVTDYDIRRGLERGLDFGKLTPRAVMNRKATTVLPDEPAAKAIKIMEERRNPFSVLPVVDKAGRSVGMIQVHDLRARGL